MTPRERIEAALNHQETDRIPIDFSGHRSSGISAIAYAKLREYLGLPPHAVRVYDPIQQLAIVEEDVLDWFGVDTIELGRGFALSDGDWVDWTLPNGLACQLPAWVKPERCGDEWVIRSENGEKIARMPEGTLYFEQCFYPFAENADINRTKEMLGECMWTAIASPPGPLVSGPDGTKRLIDGAKALRESTDRAVIGLFGGNLLETGQFLFRNDNFLMLLGADPQKAHQFLDILVEMHLERLEAFLNAVGECIDVIVFGDDLGMQSGPQISPKMYREFFKPRHKIMWNRAKELADVKVMLHCCGGVRPLLRDLIEAGLDAINPVQISCHGMDPQGLKDEFGKDLTFWGGGCDTQYFLSGAKPKDIQKHVRETIDIWRPNGGFVFQQVHNILANVPPENIVAMFDAINEND